MAMFDKFMDKAMNLAEVGMSKAKEVGEIAKLNLAIASEEDNIKKAYMEIGRIYYEAHSLNPDSEYAELCIKIGLSKSKIDENKTKIAQIKAVQDQAETCTVCSEAAPAPGVDTEVPPEEPVDPQV